MILFISMQEREEKQEIYLITDHTLPWDGSVCALACVCLYTHAFLWGCALACEKWHYICRAPNLLYYSRECIACLTVNLLSYSSFPLASLHTHTKTMKIGISQGVPTWTCTPVSTVCSGFSHSLKPEMPIIRLKWFEFNIFIPSGDLSPMCLHCSLDTNGKWREDQNMGHFLMRGSFLCVFVVTACLNTSSLTSISFHAFNKGLSTSNKE